MDDDQSCVIHLDINDSLPFERGFGPFFLSSFQETLSIVFPDDAMLKGQGRRGGEGDHHKLSEKSFFSFFHCARSV